MLPFKTPAFLGALAVAFALVDSGANGASDELVKAAVKEANLMIYGTTQIDHMHALIKQFNQKYAAIKSNYHRQGTTAVYERILREQRAGLFSADVYGGIGGLQAWLLAQKGALAPYPSPERSTISNNLKDKEGYWTAAYTVSFVTAFNTKQISRAEAPRAHDDFLLPKWRGKMWLNEDDIEWYATMVEILGKEKAPQFMRRLAQQELRYGRDPSRPPVAIGLAKNAPHGNAGKLFIDFILSQEGQRAIQNIALRYPVRPDVELTGSLLKLKGIRFWDSNWDTVFRNIDGYQKSFRQTFGFS